MGNLVSFICGVMVAVGLFAAFNFTPEVGVKAIERAVTVCKEGKWQSINNSEILCADGAIYPRKGETK